jgi:hypothetical protein
MSVRLFNPLVIAAFVLALTACGPSASMPSQADIDKEEQAIYATFFSVNTRTAVILRDTSTTVSADGSPEYMKNIASSLPGISNETLDNFVQRNIKPGQLSPDMSLGVDYVLLSTDELAQITSQPNWGEVMNEKYPNSGGYKIFSRVGFNATLDQAMIYVGHVAGPMMGGGFYYLMEKQDGQWVIKQQIMVWIS